MYNSDTELLFPTRIIPGLVSLRADTWKQFIEKIGGPSANVIEQTAFVLMMVRLGGCVGCNADSFRAMRGCTACARQTVRRYRGSDQDLIELFHQAQTEIEQFYTRRMA